jgi:hypothetical protein
VKNNPLNQNIVWLILKWGWITMSIVCVVIGGCNTFKQDTRNINKVAVRHPLLIADKANKLFPCVPIKGDTLYRYVSDSGAYQATIDLLQAKLDESNALIDSIMASVNLGDTACRKYEAAISVLKKQNADLRFRLQHIPAIHDTTIVTPPPQEDTRKVALCEDERKKVVDLLTKVSAENMKHQRQANTRGLFLLGLLLVILVIVYFKIKSSFTKK